jgi:hypothetical protein
MGKSSRTPAALEVESSIPKTVLQVFHNVVVYGKAQNNADERERLFRWQSSIPSRCGQAEGETLLLPQQLLDDRARFDRSDLLILNDYNPPGAAGCGVPLHEEIGDSGVSLLQLGSRRVGYEIFQLCRGADGFEIHLEYSRHRASIGVPGRGDYQLARLNAERPVRVTINGKTDFSLSGRLARHYVQRDYLFVLLGEFRRFAPQPDAAPARMKLLPLTAARHVDLRERLY